MKNCIIILAIGILLSPVAFGQPPTVIDNSVVHIVFNHDRGGIDALTYKYGSNHNILDPYWNQGGFGRLGSLGEPGQDETGTDVTDYDIQASGASFRYENPLYGTKELDISWSVAGGVEILLTFNFSAADDRRETRGIWEPGGNNDGNDSITVLKSDETEQTFHYWYPGPWTLIWEGDAYGTIMWDADYDERIGYRSECYLFTRFANGASADGPYHLMDQAGTYTLYFAVKNSAAFNSWFNGFTNSGEPCTGAENQPPIVEIISPNGGEYWVLGNTGEISWNLSGGQLNSISIYISRDSGFTWAEITAFSTEDAECFDWTVTGLASDNCKIKVIADGPGGVDEDISDGDFSILESARCYYLYPYNLHLSLVGQTEAQLKIVDEYGNVYRGDVTYSVLPSASASLVTVTPQGHVTAEREENEDEKGVRVHALFIHPNAGFIKVANTCVIRVLSNDYSDIHFNEDIGDNVLLYYPMEINGENLSQYVSDYEVLKVTDYSYLIQRNLMATEPDHSCAQIFEVDFGVTEGQTMCGEAGSNPIRLGWNPEAENQPNCFLPGDDQSREPQWRVLYHELGHRFTLNSQNFWDCLWTYHDPSDVALYGEAMATAMYLAAVDHILECPDIYTIDNENTTESVRQRRNSDVQDYKSDFNNWVSGVSDFEEINPNIVDGMWLSFREIYPGDFALATFFFMPLHPHQDLGDIIEEIQEANESPDQIQWDDGNHTFFAALISAVFGTDLSELFENRFNYPIVQPLFTHCYEALVDIIGEGPGLGPQQTILGLSPIDLTVTDPYGNQTSQSGAGIPFSFYAEGDYNGDGDLDDKVCIYATASGMYSIHVEPDSAANPGDTYSLLWVYENDSTFLALDEAIADIPPEGYVVSTLDTGSIYGIVSANSVGLLGVPVDLYDSTGTIIASTASDAPGFYQFPGLNNEDYSVSISTPLGYQAEEETKEIKVRGLPHEVNFELIKLEITPTQRSMGYWKHQVNVHLSGKGHAQESLADMSSYVSLVEEHFNNHPTNPIAIFEVPQPAEQTDSLEALQDLLTVKGNAGMNAKARQQLMALLLNVVSLKLDQATAISEDSATVSQAITYCHQLVTDADESNDELAKDIADQINNGMLLASGMIPLTIPDIIYRGTEDQTAQTSTLPAEFSLEQSYPNPFNPACEIGYALPAGCHVTLCIYNLLGQNVRALVDGYQGAGHKSVKWDGKDGQGQEVTSGVYFYRIQAGDFAESKRMVLLK